MVHCIVRITSSDSILPLDTFLSGTTYILPPCTSTIVPGRIGVAPRIIVSIMALSVTLFWTTEPSTEAAGNCTILALPHFDIGGEFGAAPAMRGRPARAASRR